MRSIVTKFALLAAIFVLPAFARADDLFTFTSDAGVFSFRLPASPTNAQDNTTYFGVPGVSYTLASNSGTATVYFNDLGDFAYNNGTSFPFGIHDTGAAFSGVMYTGAAATPTFVLGTYDLTYQASLGRGPGTAASLVIAQTPEPSSMMLMGTGLLGLVGAGRRRFMR